MLKKILGSPAFYVVYLVVTALVLCELATRFYFALQIGPRTLLYGTDWYRNEAPDEQAERWRKTMDDPKVRSETKKAFEAESRQDSVELHRNQLKGYTKFFPNEKKTTRDVETGERIATTINRHGFRGPEFETEKPMGTLRILTIGSSSTFGYYDRDDETYPHYLEVELNRRCGSRHRFEVINFGIPHATSDQMAAMFLEEGIRLHPDLVTFYEGRNDSTLNEDFNVGGLRKLYGVLIHRSMLVAFIDQVVVGDRLGVTAAAKQFEPHVKTRTDYLLNNLSRILLASKQHGIRMVVANQQASAAPGYPRTKEERLSRRSVTLGEEIAAIKAKQARAEPTTSFEYFLLVHERLMQGIERWAKDNGVPFVDIIAALDHDRDHLLSWVHLDATANRVVAAKFAEPILRELCPEGAK